MFLCGKNSYRNVLQKTFMVGKTLKVNDVPEAIISPIGNISTLFLPYFISIRRQLTPFQH